MKGWILYPLWGLELAENGHGLDRPIFGDATLVTRSFVQKHCPPDTRTAALLSGGGLRPVLEAGESDFAGPAPVDRLIDIAPHAFIAVRRSNPDDGVRYAESVRALLTATSVLTSGKTKGFALTPMPLHWAAVPSRVMLDAAGQLQAQYGVIASNFIYLTPVSVAHKQLSESWEQGTPIHGTWRIYKDDPLSKTLVGDWKSLSGLQKRIRTSATTLARAMESTDKTLSTLFGVVALESLLKDGASDFKEMEEMAACVFEGSNGAPEISRLFSSRHRVAHEAASPKGEAEHSQEITAAWGVLLLAALASNTLSTVDEFLSHLRGRILARRVGKRLRDSGRAELAEQVERAAKDVRKTPEGK